MASASSFDQTSDHARFLNFRSPPPTDDHHLPLPQILLEQMTPSSALSTAPKVGERAPLAARGSVSSVKKSSKRRRKPRTSKRSQTTFIAADAANFRQMVQQVTGVRFDGTTAVTCASLLRPDPQRTAADIVGMSCGNDFRGSMAGLLPAATLFELPMLSEQRAGGGGGYGEPLGFGPPLGAVGEGGVGELEWGATSFHT